MTGLEKVTGKIMADAEADAREISERADAECATITADYDARIHAELEDLRDKAERECRAVITRAKSSAAMAKRNAVLDARSRILREAYAEAEKNIKHLPAGEYLDLLLKMLKGAMRRQLEGENDSMTLYGENTSPDVYEILLNPRDRSAYGEELLERYRLAMKGKVDDRVLSRLRLSSEGISGEGGLILRCGPTEINCTFPVLFAEARRSTEVKVSRILFGEHA